MSVADLQKLQRAGDMMGMKPSEKNFQSGDFKDPKFGKVDPTGAAHVGGWAKYYNLILTYSQQSRLLCRNTWAGGSGGMWVQIKINPKF